MGYAGLEDRCTDQAGVAQPPGAYETAVPWARHSNVLNQLLFSRLREKWLQIPRANPAQLLTTAPQSSEHGSDVF